MVANLNPSGTSGGRMNDVRFYDSNLVQMTSIGSGHFDPNESLTSQQMPVAGGSSYYVKIGQYSNNAAPYELQLIFQ